VLAFLGDPEIIIGLAVLGFVLLLFRDKHHGRAFVWLAAGAVGASLMTVILQHVIVHVGPPLTLTRPIAERGLVFLRDPAIVPGFAAAGASIVAGSLFLPLANKSFTRRRGLRTNPSAAKIAGTPRTCR
jgi:hypothetical protein